MSATHGDRPMSRDGLIFRQLDDSWVIYDPDAERLHTLNLTAALVWSHLDGTHDGKAIVREVAAAFEPPATADDIVGEVGDVIDSFRAEGLLR